jgi:hypothetical protein
LFGDWVVSPRRCLIYTSLTSNGECIVLEGNPMRAPPKFIRDRPVGVEALSLSIGLSNSKRSFQKRKKSRIINKFNE